MSEVNVEGNSDLMKSVGALEESAEKLEEISEESSDELLEAEGLLIWFGRILKGIFSI